MKMVVSRPTSLTVKPMNPRRAIRASLTATGLLLAFVSYRTIASDPARAPQPLPEAGTGAGSALDRERRPLEHRFREQVRPFLATYCVECHGKDKPKGDLDLSARRHRAAGRGRAERS